MVPVEAKQKILLVKKAVVGDDKQISLTPPEVLDNVQPGMQLLDDGYIIAKVVEVSSKGAVLEIENQG